MVHYTYLQTFVCHHIHGRRRTLPAETAFITVSMIYFQILWWLSLLLTLKRLEVHLCALWNDCNAISWLLFFGFPDCILYTINVNWFKMHFMFKISGKTKIILNMSAKWTSMYPLLFFFTELKAESKIHLGWEKCWFIEHTQDGGQ